MLLTSGKFPKIGNKYVIFFLIYPVFVHWNNTNKLWRIDFIPMQFCGGLKKLSVCCIWDQLRMNQSLKKFLEVFLLALFENSLDILHASFRKTSGTLYVLLLYIFQLLLLRMKTFQTCESERVWALKILSRFCKQSNLWQLDSQNVKIHLQLFSLKSILKSREFRGVKFLKTFSVRQTLRN